jgi:glucosyl-3-phosphoglycerate phosphatase
VTRSETSGVTRLVVWRHGHTDWNRDSRVQGQTDTPLNDTGRAQAAAAASLLAGLDPGVIVSSDLRRAAETAAALAALTGLPVRRDERLRERHYGRWQGHTLAEVAERFPAEHARWRAGDPAPGCDIESLDDLGKRVGQTLQEAADAAAGRTVVVATHGGGAKQGMAWLLGWLPDMSRSVAGLDNCHWAELRHDARGWRLWSYNVGASTRVEPPLSA